MNQLTYIEMVLVSLNKYNHIELPVLKFFLRHTQHRYYLAIVHQKLKKQLLNLKKQAEEMMRTMSPEQMEEIQKAFANMGPEEKEEIMRKGKEMGLV